MMTKGGIYRITNTVNGMMYIGQVNSSNGFNKRWQHHKYRLEKNAHCNIYFQRAWNKYGKDTFRFGVICYCSDHLLDLMETSIITGLRSESMVYNIAPGGSVQRGMKHSSESRAKMSVQRKGKRQSPEHIAKRAEAHKGWKPSNELRARWSKSHSGANAGNRHTAARPVICTNPITHEVKQYPYMKAAEQNGFLCSGISKCCLGERAAYRGLLWKYADNKGILRRRLRKNLGGITVQVT